jgi:hypothetical protein
MAGTYDEEVCRRIEAGKTVVLAGLSLVGKQGAMVAVVGIIRKGSTTPEGMHVHGWSFNAGHPEERFRMLRYFDTERSTEDICFPVPNCMVYFGCDTDPSLVEEDADAEVLQQIVRFVMPFISDAGPPKGIDW